MKVKMTSRRAALLGIGCAVTMAATAHAASHAYFDSSAYPYPMLSDVGAQSGIHALYASHGRTLIQGRMICVAARDQWGNQIGQVSCGDDTDNPIVKYYGYQTARAYGRAGMGTATNARLRSEW